MARVNLRQIAERAGTDHTVVSRVLNGKAAQFRIGEHLAARVQATAREMGYVPNGIARALRTRRTQIVALWVPTIQAFQAQAMRAVRRCLIADGYHFIVHVLAPGSGERSPGAAEVWSYVDGILCLGVSHAVEVAMASGLIGDVPVVSIGDACAEETDGVIVDLQPGCQEAARHLVAAGCRRIAILSLLGHRPTDPRATAYAAAMRDAGLDPEYIPSQGTSRPSGHRAVLEYVRERGLPDAIFCYNDVMAIGAYRALRDLGARVPDDVALIGCDDIEDASFLEVPLTTIHVPINDMCSCGWERLKQRIEEPDGPRERVVFPSYLVVRHSSQRGRR